MSDQDTNRNEAPENGKDMLISEAALGEALRRDRAGATPPLGGAAKARLLAMVAERGTARRSAGLAGNPLAALRAVFGPVADTGPWRTLAAAAIAGVIAGTTLSGPLYAGAGGDAPVSLEEDFISVLGGDALTPFLEEEDA